MTRCQSRWVNVVIIALVVILRDAHAPAVDVPHR
jgi:hypothetical protein